MNTNDSQAIRIALQGDKSGYEALIKKYKKMVYGIAWSHLGDRDLSEDVAQETFIKAYSYLRTLRDPDKFQGWLAMIARNISTSMSRRVRREDAFKKQWAILESEDAEPRQEEPEPLNQQLWESFAELPPIHREALTLFYIEGKSVTEAAAALGITEQALKTRLHRARTALRQQLEQKLEDTLSELQPSKSFTHSVLVLLPMTPKGAIGTGGALAVLGNLFASLSFALWISVASTLPALGLFTMYSKLDEASLKDTPGNQPIKMSIRRMYMKAVAGMFVTFVVVFGLLIPHFKGSGLSAILQISCIGWAYLTWRAFKPLRVNTSLAVIGGAMIPAIILVSVLAIAFLHASSLLWFIAVLLISIISYFTTQNTPPRVGFNLFTGSALGIFGDFEDDKSLGRRLTRTEMLSFAKFLGGLWLVQDYRWSVDGITLFAAGSRVTITWDGACTAMMSAKDLKVARQLLVGRSVEAAELQDNACRSVRYALNCFLRGDLEAVRKDLSPYETPSAQSLTTTRHNRVKSLVGIILGITCLVTLLMLPQKPVGKKIWLPILPLTVWAAGLLVAMVVMAITLYITRRRNHSADEEDGDRRKENIEPME